MNIDKEYPPQSTPTVVDILRGGVLLKYLKAFGHRIGVSSWSFPTWLSFVDGGLLQSTHRFVRFARKLHGRTLWLLKVSKLDSDLGFTFRKMKGESIEIVHHRHLAGTLRGDDAARFLAKIERLSGERSSAIYGSCYGKLQTR